MDSIFVYVTQADIDGSSQCDAEACPIARALMRIPGVKKCVVGATAARMLMADGGTRFVLLPERARRIVDNFDVAGKQAVTPTTFMAYVVDCPLAL